MNQSIESTAIAATHLDVLKNKKTTMQENNLKYLHNDIVNQIRKYSAENKIHSKKLDTQEPVMFWKLWKEEGRKCSLIFHSIKYQKENELPIAQYLIEIDDEVFSEGALIYFENRYIEQTRKILDAAFGRL